MTKPQQAVHEYFIGVVPDTPVVLIHGFPFDHSMWRAQVVGLMPEFQRIIAPDLRGFGESALADGDATTGVSMQTYAADIAESLDRLAITEPVILCGFSMGGYILWQFAKHYPERVKAIIACDTRAIADSEEASAGRIKMAEKVMAEGTDALIEGMLPKLLAVENAKNQPELVEQVTSMMRKASPAAVAAALRGMARRPDVTEDLASFDWPALVLCGAEDAISPSDEMREIAESLPQGKFCEIASAGHMTGWENPTAVNEALRTFLQSL